MQKYGRVSCSCPISGIVYSRATRGGRLSKLEARHRCTGAFLVLGPGFGNLQIQLMRSGVAKPMTFATEMKQRTMKVALEKCSRERQ